MYLPIKRNTDPMETDDCSRCSHYFPAHGLNNELYFTDRWVFSLPDTSNHAYLYSKLKREGLSVRQAFAYVPYLQTLCFISPNFILPSNMF